MHSGTWHACQRACWHPAGKCAWAAVCVHYQVSVCRWFTVSPQNARPDAVQVLEEVLPTYEFEAKRAKITGKRTREYPRVPVRGLSALLMCTPCLRRVQLTTKAS